MSKALTDLLVICSNLLLVCVSIVGIIVSLRDAYHHDERQSDQLERMARAMLSAAEQDERNANLTPDTGAIPQPPATSPRRKAISPRKTDDKPPV